MGEKKNEDDRGLWNEYVNDQTGESSIKEHKLKKVWTSCKEKEHEFELTADREVTCNKCGYVKNFIVGFEKFENGKIVKL